MTEFDVIDSDLGTVQEGTTLSVERDHTNEFTNRRVITVAADPLPDHRVGTFQLFRTPDMPKDIWKEIVVGRESDTVCVSEV